MKRYFTLSLMTLACVLPLSLTPCVEAADDIKAAIQAERIVKGVRLASTLQNNDLNGHLRKKGKRTPIGLFLRGENIQFQYQENKVWQVYHMRLKQNQFDLFQIRNGKNVAFPKEKLGQPIMNSDLTYEDLAFRFLYWPNPKIVGQQKIKLQPCHKIRLENPGSGGRYDIVYIWVHQKYNALMQVVGYDKKGKILKKFHVTDLMDVDGGKGKTLKKMNVETYNPTTGKVTGISYLEFKEPKPAARKGLGGPPKR
ncbi:outer membrane lipoprotein-sorting protein [Verrucomicrobiaceae bacterium N1E253]|uniref:Outer membrane lipoprotein-sorting protein n=1 Tax=Oceaniferula marina TaxID=2748318 RepID=A0A851GA54_9BACT|nr:outer membrane lipoprotein-sorting protein [Oceaniferula marina]NWK54493.1 outer membrane lipoprotein-sorting protein [Oceaniferula marina]